MDFNDLGPRAALNTCYLLRAQDPGTPPEQIAEMLMMLGVHPSQDPSERGSSVALRNLDKETSCSPRPPKLRTR